MKYKEIIIGVIIGILIYALYDVATDTSYVYEYRIDSLESANNMLQIDIDYANRGIVALDSEKVVFSNTHFDRLDSIDTFNADSLFKLINETF